jgi:hypothetical protein
VFLLGIFRLFFFGFLCCLVSQALSLWMLDEDSDEWTTVFYEVEVAETSRLEVRALRVLCSFHMRSALN